MCFMLKTFLTGTKRDLQDLARELRLRGVRSLRRPDVSWRRARARCAPRISRSRGIRRPACRLARVAAEPARRRGFSRGRRRDAHGARGRPRIVWGLGAHVIKTGLAPVLIDLMERGFVSAIALNGAGLIHDFEIALAGATSEDVDAALGPGQFGMAEETGRVLNEAIAGGARRGARARPVGRRHLCERRQPPHRAAQPALRRGAPRDSGHRARRHRHRHHPHAPGRVGRSDRRGEPARLPLLHVVRRAASRAACT